MKVNKKDCIKSILIDLLNNKIGNIDFIYQISNYLDVRKTIVFRNIKKKNFDLLYNKFASDKENLELFNIDSGIKSDVEWCGKYFSLEFEDASKDYILNRIHIKIIFTCKKINNKKNYLYV